MQKTLRKVALRVILVAVFIALIAAAALVKTGSASGVSDEYKLKYTQPSVCYTAEQGYTLKVYIPAMLWNYSVSLRITYQRVKLNSAATDNVPSANGVVTDKDFDVLDAEGTVAILSKADERVKDNLSSSTVDYPKYFELTTHSNCAYVFTVTRGLGAEEDSTYYQTVYFRRIDSKEPTLSKPTRTVVSGIGMRLTFNVYDNTDIKSAVSGVERVLIYEEDKEEPVYTKICETVNSVLTSVSFICALNKHYYIELKDFAGNTSGRVFLFYHEDDTYNAEAEAEYENAMNDFKNVKFASRIVNAVTAAYTEYYVTTRDASSTEKEKNAALGKLNEALKMYIDASEAYETYGRKITLNVETANAESIPSLTVFGAERGLDFLPIGDAVTMTLSAAYFERSDCLTDKELLGIAADGLTRADEMYQITVKTVSENEFELRRRFSSEPELRFEAGEYKQIAAVQTVYNVSGGETTYRCVAVGHTDGTVSVSVPYTGGIVKVFVVRDKGKNLYWLFSLVALPLLLGAAMLIYAFRRMKNVKEEALKKQQQEELKQPEEKKKTPPKNKKKKK